MKLPLVLNITRRLPACKASAHVLFPFIKNRGVGWLFFCPQAALPASFLAWELLQYILCFLNISQWPPRKCHIAPLPPSPTQATSQLCPTTLWPPQTRPCLSWHLHPSPVPITTQISEENRSATFSYARVLFPVTITKNERLSLY